MIGARGGFVFCPIGLFDDTLLCCVEVSDTVSKVSILPYIEISNNCGYIVHGSFILPNQYDIS